MASLSFLVNRAMMKRLGPTVIIGFGPVFEEAAKTILAYYLYADILVTHVVFGVLEAGYDYLTGSRNRLGAAMGSVVGHMVFGLVTVYVISVSGSLWLGLVCASVVHLCWNVLAVLFYAH
jgi:hypothetical protein